MSNQIQEKSVLVIGASGGIGAEIVRAFVQAGAREVIAAGRKPPRHLPEGVGFIEMDVVSPESVRRAAAQVADKVSIVVNSSGINEGRRLSDIDLAGARREMEVNYFGLLNVYEAFAPAMRARKEGTFVNLLSVLAHANLPLMATYCASKAAALSLTQAMRAELAGFGVRVCAILPAVVDTAMSSAASSPKMSPIELADEIVEGVINGVEDLYPGTAAQLRIALQKDWKAVERSLAARLPPGSCTHARRD
ncbi:SDR family NAD(P)-dependent oxidoreductase [Pusillimonas noertemannii]|uniref:Ketoreductase domain-containing protein n=1 Tax=Pusillimonas noertemannii TaxID=305977 RepID=A0A2U1CKX4_9BURK|nr:SDR family NAD(P)-dependent oxidoreductase [Pusillimonas noertemannii]PVY61669.1 hypothetical protein C7440_2399 [Pusillimonas noertemannii]TFL09610.1 SDR family NAD(P)-dependent oxidoreductase [Pusillimonas noertemannii]